jgi:hypothetical protein
VNRNTVIVGVFAILAAASAIGFGLMFSRLGGDACLDGFGEGAAGGACPALAEVQGMRYEVAVATELIDIEADLIPYEEIGRTNVAGDFAQPLTFRIGSIDPTAVIAASARRARDEDVGPYRLLFGPNEDDAFPALCDYIPLEQREADTRCGAPA